MHAPMNPLYNLVDGEYHESFDAYQPRSADFLDFVAAHVPSDWFISRKGIWFHCASPNNSFPQQGWKIHVSATPANARELLQCVTSVLFAQPGADFKFALDFSTLFLLNSKTWPRGGSGKFITIYPQDTRHFLDLLARLHQVTRHLKGPYILSDHRYPESRVLFYRYGGMRTHEALDVTGERIPMLVRPDGAEVPDQRLPYPVTPSWAPSGMPADEPREQGDGSLSLKIGRYQVEGVLSFSNGGGVYQGLDRETGERVVIKEARPCVNATADGRDAIDLLKKEHRLLCLVEKTGIAPRPVDLFQEWEHWFLVEEFIDGSRLSSYSAQNNVLLRTRATLDDRKQWYASFRNISLSLARAIETLHGLGIVFADLSPANVMVLPDETVRLIDFEGAFPAESERASELYTPGFASPQRLAGLKPVFEDDYYSMGAVLMSCLFPRNGLFHLRPESKEEMLKAIEGDASLPAVVSRILLELMHAERKQRLSPAQAASIIGTAPELTEQAARDSEEYDYEEVIAGIANHLETTATYARRDRLFPADPMLFSTNPLSLAYGAAGTAYAMNKVSEKFPDAAVRWILSHKITPETYAPGLYIGISGVAWVLLELGLREEAERLFRLTENHRLLYASPDLFHGASGWGLACLRFFAATQNEFYLDLAKEAGQRLLEIRHESTPGCFWENGSELRLGVAHGASGIALFLLYLYLASGESRFLETGGQGLEFELSLATATRDGGKSWRRAVGADTALYPFWRFGSAGVGSVVLRYWNLLGSDCYGSVLDQISIDVERKYAVFPGRFLGLAGLGDFLLDMHEFTGKARYFKSASTVAQGLMQFRVKRGSGVAFPGDALSRLCCDYATGSAGVALFLNRLLGRQGNDFMLDSHFGTGVQRWTQSSGTGRSWSRSGMKTMDIEQFQDGNRLALSRV